MKLDWAGYSPTRPTFSGTRIFRTYDVADLVPYIDWTPFLQTYEFKGRFPAILDDPAQGPAARALYEDAQQMLTQIVEERWFNPKAVIGFWPANTVGDDIRLYTGESPHGDARHLPRPAPAALEARRAPERVPVGLRRAGR